MPRLSRRFSLALALAAGPASAQAPAVTASPISAEPLRLRLFALAHDSMGGRESGSEGNFKAAEYVAAEFRRFGLLPAGENGTFFQTVPLGRIVSDTGTRLAARGVELRMGEDYLAVNLTPGATTFAGTPVVFGGVATDSSTWLTEPEATGKIVVLRLGAGGAPRPVNPRPIARQPRFAGAAAIALVEIDYLSATNVRRILRGNITVIEGPSPVQVGPVELLISIAAAERLFGAPIGGLASGALGTPVSGVLRVVRRPFDLPARNVIAILPGSDPALRGSYVSLTAHNDHVGFTSFPVDHDSIRAYNRVVRPMGADTPDRPPDPTERARIRQILDSVRALRPARADSILNGADDDGTGTVALLEIARALAALPQRPKRSILFVSHTAEEMGLLGSRWYTDHPTVPRDSIVAEIDEDMVGRGGSDDLPKGGPGYLEIIGARRLSTEFGDILEAVNRRQPLPFSFNYEYDAPGHPLQYYCRADHYSYARYGIPSVSLSRGEHQDYHQVTDEAQYVDYEALARVARLVFNAARAIGDLDHRPVVDHPPGDPDAPCRQ